MENFSEIPRTTPDMAVEIPGETEREPTTSFYSPDSFEKRFRVPEGFLENPSHRVLFEQAKILLCGDVPHTDDRDVAYAEAFLDALMMNESGGPDGQREEMLRKNADPLLTSRIREALVRHDEFSKLKRQREALGIRNPEDEKPFDVVVVRTASRGRVRRQEEWQQQSGAPTLFVSRDSEGDRPPVMFIPDFEAEEMLSSRDAHLDFKMVEHEYRHTQRSFSFGQDRLFRFIDEVATNVQGYGKQTALLRVLCLTTPELRGADFKKAYESGNEDHKAALLATFAKFFGPKGLLLLGGKKSSEHSGDDDGLPNLPFAKDGEAAAGEDARFAETILRQRAEQDQDFLETLEQNIGQATMPLGTLEVLANMYLKPYVSQDAGSSRLMRQVIDRLQLEIGRRKLAGEKGLHDA